LPLDTEWTTAAGGEAPAKRFPWDAPGQVTTDEKEITRRANVHESDIGHTTPVNAYLLGASSHGVMDMAGNEWERLANNGNQKEGRLGIRGGSWGSSPYFARVAFRADVLPDDRDSEIGFRVVILPSG
jgi:gamma-glutamyl hercynylcysteine S-oxide synthase